MEYLFDILFYKGHMIAVLEKPLYQLFYRRHRHLKKQELVNLKNVYKILLLYHHHLEIYYLFQNLDFVTSSSHVTLTKVKFLIRYFLCIWNFGIKFSSGSIGSWYKVFHRIFLQI